MPPKNFRHNEDMTGKNAGKKREEQEIRKGGGQKFRRDDILITRGKRRRSATPGLNANEITPATVVRQEKQCSYMAGNTEMMKKAIFCICFIYRLLKKSVIGSCHPKFLGIMRI